MTVWVFVDWLAKPVHFYRSKPDTMEKYAEIIHELNFPTTRVPEFIISDRG